MIDPLKVLTTKSGIPITIGTGCGTKWQWLKKAGSEPYCQPVIDQLALSIKNGFNHIDTADVYTTAPEVRKALEVTGVKREDVFITTKYAPFIVKGLKPPATLTEGLDKLLAEMDTDYFDLFLIHCPFFAPEYGYTIESIWEEMIGLKKEGKVRHIGVSNFAIKHIEACKKVSPTVDFYPQVNQLEFHPFLQEQTPGIIEYCHDNDILIQGFKSLSPLSIFAEEELTAFLEQLSTKYGKTTSQILLKYDLQKGIMPITTSSNEQRIKDSLNLDFELDTDDITKIDTIGASKPRQRFFFPEFDGPEFQQ